jgi:light-regulated signal transduction histidine kinase (bacteriophytochrome)
VSVFVELFKKEKSLKEQTKKLHEAELEALRLKQREREQQFEQEKILAVNRMLEDKVQERTAELEAFCYSVSHDLRSPLRSINSYSSSLEQDFGSTLSEETILALRKIENATRKMDEMILGLLGLSRITRSEIRVLSLDLCSLSKSIVDDLKAYDSNRLVKLITPEHPIVATGDPALIKSLMFNLIENAWKFTSEREESVIEVGAVEEDGRVVYSVKDNGAGFDSRYANKLFHPFERLHTDRDFPGNGIGLATVMRIVRKHGGAVWAESEVGQGAQFFFTLEATPVA